LNLYVELVRLYLDCVGIVCNIIIFTFNCLLRIKIGNYFFIPRISISSGSRTAADGSLELLLMTVFVVVLVLRTVVVMRRVYRAFEAFDDPDRDLVRFVELRIFSRCD
jgi:ABC-type siderophore export system fused ATPase/permease subunit